MSSRKESGIKDLLNPPDILNPWRICVKKQHCQTYMYSTIASQLCPLNE